MDWQGHKIRDLAKERNLPLTKLAELTGVSRQTVTEWIGGQVPKGAHLIAICKTLQISPDALFVSPVETQSISIPIHRIRKRAIITTEMQRAAFELASEYELLFRNASEPSVVPVIRIKDRSNEVAYSIANHLLKLSGHDPTSPIRYQETFKLAAKLGISIIFRSFPETLKAYAFYTRINGYRVIFVDTKTNLLDLIFPILHEYIHAIRDEVAINSGYDQEEEDFCDSVANYVQFPDYYVRMVYNALSHVSIGSKVQTLKRFGKEYRHSLFGIVKRIRSLYPDFSINIGGADTNLKKESYSIGDILFANDNPKDYIRLLQALSPIFTQIVAAQVISISFSKLAELFGFESSLDAKLLKEELSLSYGQSC